MNHNLHHKLTLSWLYPELMSTYGDRGNIIVLQRIAEDNEIDFKVERINQKSDSSLLKSSDLVFMGGAQDLQQEIVGKDLTGEKGEALKQLIENETPGLYICGAYQFLGNYYKDAYGTEIPGLGIFDMHTESFKTKDRLIGNVIIEPNLPTTYNLKPTTPLLGFENHGGRTYLGKSAQPFAKVIKGHGNNGEDKTEGILFKNSIGTYLHGPILPTNPELAVHLLEVALKHKYNKGIKLTHQNPLAEKARERMLEKIT